MKKNYAIKPDFAGTRLDRWLKKVVCDIPQSLIEKTIRKLGPESAMSLPQTSRAKY